MQPLNAIAVRQPANTAPVGGAVAPTPAPTEPVTAESLGWQLRAALPPMRLHSVSLYDEQANVLWLSEGALGPDEHNVIVEATDALGAGTTLPYHETSLEDGRVAIVLPVRSPQGGLVGLAMILADIKSVGEGVLERMITPQTRTVMQKLAVLMRPAQPRAVPAESALQVMDLALDIPTAAPATQAGAPALSPPRTTPPHPVRASQAAADSHATLSPQAVNDMLEFELTPDLPATAPQSSSPRHLTAQAPVNGAEAAGSAAPVPLIDLPLSVPSIPEASPSSVIPTSAVTAPPPVTSTAPTNSSSTGTSKSLGGASVTGTSRTLGGMADATCGTAATSTSRVLAMPEGLSLILEVQPFSKLRTGGRTRRYEVVARSSQPNRSPPGLDKIALQQLLAWMASNRAAWTLEPTSFTLNLSIRTLEDERFPQFVAANLKSHGIAGENIGFEIAEPLCLQRRAQVERFITLCDKLGCFVVIDDFTLDSSIVSLLRSKALRLVKIDPRLTSVALKDKLAQAMVVAIAQAVKVLGIHCAAKRVDSPSGLQWLTAIGCDFAQGPALGQMQALESLGSPSPATPGPTAA